MPWASLSDGYECYMKPLSNVMVFRGQSWETYDDLRIHKEESEEEELEEENKNGKRNRNTSSSRINDKNVRGTMTNEFRNF